MTSIRRARLGDAAGIAAVHVASWRSAYASVLPDQYLARLSESRLAAQYDRAIRFGLGLHVAADVNTTHIYGFTSARKAQPGAVAEGEVETLYVLDDFKERGLGRQLLRASAKHLAALGCRSAFAWVLRDNPSVFFYQHLGGKRTATSTTHVAGREIPQHAYAWDPIGLLIDVDA
jgi:ribosomal protein S18 acetylase RimI-like enzyme